MELPEIKRFLDSGSGLAMREYLIAKLEELKSIVYNTVWHEVAHYYGLDHNQIRELDQK